jgi:sialidase-1
MQRVDVFRYSQRNMLTRTNLFEAGKGGYALYRIPGLLVTPRGAILATCEARRGTGGDWDDNDVVMRRSLDDGASWEPPCCMVEQRQYGAGPVSNFVLIADSQEQTLHALYCHNYARVFYMRSADDGSHFAPRTDITPVLEAFRRDYPWRVVATGPGHAVQLRNGRLIVPIWMSDGSGTEFGPGKLGHRPSCVSLIYSDDHGRTWQRGEIVVRSEFARNPSETLAVELADGSVLFNIRSEADEHRRLVSVSPDGVSGWSTPRFDSQLLEPVCMASLIRYTWPAVGAAAGAPGRILFANPDNLERTYANWSPACDRKQLAVKLSFDDCRTWPISKVIEPGPAGYSDLAVAGNGDVLCLYESGAVTEAGDTRALSLARFDLDWLGA